MNDQCQLVKIIRDIISDVNPKIAYAKAGEICEVRVMGTNVCILTDKAGCAFPANIEDVKILDKEA